MTKTATKEKKSPLKVILTDGSNLNLVVDKAHHLYNPRAEGPPVDPTLPARIERLGWTHGAIKASDVPNEDGSHDVIAGRQRTKALFMVNAKRKAEGKPPILAPVILTSKEESEDSPEGHYLQFTSMFNDNHGAAEDGILLEARLVQKMLVLGEEAGLKKAQILKDAMVILGCKSIDTVKNRMKVLRTPKAAQDLYKEGKITASDLYKLAQVKEEKQEAALKQIPQKHPEDGGIRRKPAKKPGDRKQGEGKKRPTSKVIARYMEVMGEGHKAHNYMAFCAGQISENTFQKRTGHKL